MDGGDGDGSVVGWDGMGLGGYKEMPLCHSADYCHLDGARNKSAVQ